MSNPYQLIEDLSKALREKQDELDAAEAESSDRADELFNTSVEIDQLNENLNDASRKLYDANILIEDLRKAAFERSVRFQQDGEEIQKLHVELNEAEDGLNEVCGINESLREGLIASQDNVSRLNELVESLNHDVSVARDAYYAKSNEVDTLRAGIEGASASRAMLARIMCFPLRATSALSFLNSPSARCLDKGSLVLHVDNITSWGPDWSKDFVDVWLSYNRLG